MANKRKKSEPALTQSADEKAYAYIRSQIIHGQIAPGNRLPEQTVAEQIGLSRTPVRAAIHRLVNEGLMEFRRNVGAVVRVLTPDEISQLFQIRSVIEGFAAELAATQASPAAIERLEALSDQMAELASRNIPDLRLIGRLNNEFHFELISSCGNVHARQVAMTLGNLNIALGSYAMESREVLMRSMIYHKELIDALKARNPGWARSVMVAHLESGRAVVAARVAVPEVDAAKPAKGHKPARRKTTATLKG